LVLCSRVFSAYFEGHAVIFIFSDVLCTIVTHRRL
jgi:hypothetical protein